MAAKGLRGRVVRSALARLRLADIQSSDSFVRLATAAVAFSTRLIPAVRGRAPFRHHNWRWCVYVVG